MYDMHRRFPFVAVALAGGVWFLAHAGDQPTALDAPWSVVCQTKLIIRARFAPDRRDLRVVVQESKVSRLESPSPLWVARVVRVRDGEVALSAKDTITEQLESDTFCDVIAYGDGRMGVLFVHDGDNPFGELLLGSFADGQWQVRNVVRRDFASITLCAQPAPSFAGPDVVVGTDDHQDGTMWITRRSAASGDWGPPAVFGHGECLAGLMEPDVQQVLFLPVGGHESQWRNAASRDQAVLLKEEAKEGRYWDDVKLGSNGQVTFSRYVRGPIRCIPLPADKNPGDQFRVIPGTDNAREGSMAYAPPRRLVLVFLRPERGKPSLWLVTSSDAGTSWSAAQRLAAPGGYLTLPIVAIYDGRVWLGITRCGHDESQLLLTTLPSDLLWPK